MAPTLSEIILFGTLGASTFAAKAVMSPLPNIEPVSLMVMLFAVIFGVKSVYPIIVYIMLEYLVYGLNLWSINYMYIWFILMGAALALRKMENRLGWAVLSGAFGLLFGLLCAPVYLFVGGPGYAVSWWISGIPFDVLHCAGNFVLALVLFVPMRELLEKLYAKLLSRRSH